MDTSIKQGTFSGRSQLIPNARVHLPTLILICFPFQIDPIIQEGNEGVVHHMVLYECSDDFPRSNLSYEGTLDSPDMPPAVEDCAGPTVIVAWAVGGAVLVTKCCAHDHP